MPQNYQIFKEWPHQTEYDQRDISIFLQKAYWEAHLKQPQIFPLCMRNSAGKLIAFCCFAQKLESWKSPYLAPYSKVFATSETAYQIFMQQAFNYLADVNTIPVEISYPANYRFHQLLGRNLYINKVDISHHLPVTAETNFVKLIKEKEKRRRLKKLHQQAFTITEIASAEYQHYYEHLLSWRKLKDHKNLIPLEKLLLLKKKFPENYHFIKLHKKGDLLGLSIFIQENSENIYTYIVMANPMIAPEEYNLLLWNHIYKIAKTLKVNYIDMGTSMLDQKINKGLASYKCAIGGQLSRKYSLICR